MLAWVVTDGTLFDAMRCATYTMGSPLDMEESHTDWSEESWYDEVEPAWAERLAPISHPALRDHLGEQCGVEEHVGWGEHYRANVSYAENYHCADLHRWLAGRPGYSFVMAWASAPREYASGVFAVHPDGEA